MKLVPSYSRLIVKPAPKVEKSAGGIYLPETVEDEDIAQGTIAAVCEHYLGPSGPIKHSFQEGQLVFYQRDKQTVPVNIEGESYDIVHIDSVEAVVISE